jgi:hypothetical protein
MHFDNAVNLQSYLYAAGAVRMIIKWFLSAGNLLPANSTIAHQINAGKKLND